MLYKDTHFQNCNTGNYCLQVNADALKLNTAIKFIKHNMNILTPKKLKFLNASVINTFCLGFTKRKVN